MYIIKFVGDDCAEIFKKRKIRIGTIKYYRKIENGRLRDPLEGQGIIKAAFKTITASDFNKIFSESGICLNEPWKIEANGCPIIDNESTFNTFIFCMTACKNLSDIKAIGKHLNKNNIFYLRDMGMLCNELSGLILGNINRISGSTINDHIKIRYQYAMVNYNNTEKTRHVDPISIGNFNPKSVDFIDLITKPTKFRIESEIRIIFCIYDEITGAYSSFTGVDYIDCETKIIHFTQKRHRCRNLHFRRT